MRHILLILLSLFTLNSHAQHQQQGVVVQYNESNAKTPLANVEIVATYQSVEPGTKKKKSATKSTMSSKNGAFTFDFNTLEAGQSIYVTANLSGYEIFNKDAISKYNLSRDKKQKLEIVMVESKKFRALCQKYYSVSSQSYARQMQKELDELTALRKANKLAENDYRRKIAEVKTDYEQKKQNIAIYAEQFARIDLETISDEEREIIMLVQDGKLDEALERYEKLNPGAMYVALSKDISKISLDIIKVEELIKLKTNYAGRIYYNINKQIDLYKEEGGEENYIKVGELLKKAALADTSNIEVVEKYAIFAELDNNTEEAIEFYNIALSTLQEGDELYPRMKTKIEELVNKK